MVDRLPKPLWPEARRDETARWLHEQGQDQAAETLYRDWDDFTAFYDFPAEHWLHFKIVERLGHHWRTLNGGATLMALVLGGELFVDGILVRRPPAEEVRAA